MGEDSASRYVPQKEDMCPGMRKPVSHGQQCPMGEERRYRKSVSIKEREHVCEVARERGRMMDGREVMIKE